MIISWTVSCYDSDMTEKKQNQSSGSFSTTSLITAFMFQSLTDENFLILSIDWKSYLQLLGCFPRQKLKEKK